MLVGDAYSTRLTVIIMDANSEPILIYCAYGDIENATGTARLAIQKKLAACVNLIPQIKSFYEWEGALEESDECLLIAKTTQACIPMLKDLIVAEHNYDEPGVVSLAISGGSQSYLEWIVRQTIKI